MKKDLRRSLMALTLARVLIKP